VKPPIPVWPASLRNGLPAPGEIWPADVELVSLRVGLRRLIKRETSSARETAESEAWLGSQGLAVRSAGTVVFAAAEGVLCDEAARAEADLGRAENVRWLGEALGYPRCCIEAFLTLPLRDDASLFAARLPAFAASPAPAETLWLSAPLRVISHTPCGPRCGPTIVLAERVLETMERRARGWSGRWRKLAARVHAIDEGGRSLAFLMERERIVDPIELRADVPGLLRAAPEVDGKGLDELRVKFAADHRG